jgi:hypothetical protein
LPESKVTWKVLVVRQPWAWLICIGPGGAGGPKDIENRPVAWRYRGGLLIAASAGRGTRRQWGEAVEFAKARGVDLPERSTLGFGGIIGAATLRGSVTSHPSPWFEGPNGLVLADRRPLPFTPIVGRLGLFDPPVEAMRRLARYL